MKVRIQLIFIALFLTPLLVPYSLSFQNYNNTISSTGTVVPIARLTNFSAIRAVNLIGYDIEENRLNAADYERIRSLGFNAVQFHLPWHLIEPSQGVYDAIYISKVDKQMNLANDKNLGVLIKIVVSRYFAERDCWVSEDNLWNDATVQNRFYDLWRMLVNRYKNYDNILAWNLANEPSAQASDPELAKRLWNGQGIVSSKAISAIRELDSRTIVFMPAPSSALSFSWLEPVPFENIAYAISFYEPYSVTHYGQQYNGNYDTIKKTWAPAKAFASSHNVQVWIQEFGINIDDYGGEPPSQSRLLWVEHVLDLAKEEKIGWCYWLYSVNSKWSFSMLNSDGSERAVVSIIRAAVSA